MPCPTVGVGLQQCAKGSGSRSVSEEQQSGRPMALQLVMVGKLPLTDEELLEQLAAHFGGIPLGLMEDRK